MNEKHDYSHEHAVSGGGGEVGPGGAQRSLVGESLALGGGEGGGGGGGKRPRRTSSSSKR